jgi:hypothetical protein
MASPQRVRYVTVDEVFTPYEVRFTNRRIVDVVPADPVATPEPSATAEPTPTAEPTVEATATPTATTDPPSALGSGVGFTG